MPAFFLAINNTPLIIGLGALVAVMAAVAAWLFLRVQQSARQARRFKEMTESKDRIMQKANDA
ncbi:MAG: hypothetical protein ACOCZ8_02325, partial [Bacteroidota bacterium]